MAHVAKFAAGAVGNMCGHYGRTEGDGVRRSNESIDPARTHLNYNLAPEHDGGQVAFIGSTEAAFRGQGTEKGRRENPVRLGGHSPGRR